MANLAVLARELPALLADSEPSKRAAGTALDIESVLEDAQEGAARVSGIVRDLRALSRGDDILLTTGGAFGSSQKNLNAGGTGTAQKKGGH